MSSMKKLISKFTEPVEENGPNQEKLEQVELMWNWLRLHLDSGAQIYQKTGSDKELRSCLAKQALEDTITYLDSLRQNNIVWSHPGRDERPSQIKLQQQIGNSWVIVEYYHDFSRLEYYQNDRLVDVKEANGEQRALVATIEVDEDESYYYITKVAPLS